MSAKFYRLLTILICLLGTIGIGSIGLSLINRHLQTQRMQQLQRANNLLAQKKYAAAVTAYDRLLEINEIQPDWLWTNRGYALLGLKQYESARESCTTATSVRPKADLAWNCSGEALYHLDRQQDALTAFKQAIALDRSKSTYQLNYGRALTKLSQHQEAAAVLSKAISLLESENNNPKQNENIAIASNDLGHSLLALRQNRRALAAFERSLAVRSESLSAQQGKGIALYRLRRYQQANKLFTSIVQRQELTQQQQAINWLYKGISLCHTPQADKAKEAFERVLKLTDNSPLQKIAEAGCGIR